MIPNCSSGHDASIGTQRDLRRSNVEVDLSRALCTMLFAMTSGDLNIDLTQKKVFSTKVVGLSTIYQMAFAVCRYASWFSRSDGGPKSPPPPPPDSEPFRARPE